MYTITTNTDLTTYIAEAIGTDRDDDLEDLVRELRVERYEEHWERRGEVSPALSALVEAVEANLTGDFAALFDAAMEAVEVTRGEGVARVRDAQDTWLSRAIELDATRARAESGELRLCGDRWTDYADICADVRGPVVALSGRRDGEGGELDQLLRAAAGAELIGEHDGWADELERLGLAER